MHLSVTSESFPLAEVFTISRGSKTHADVLTVRLSDGTHKGWGECVPYKRYGETLDSVTAEIEGLPEEFDRASLMDLLPAGAARNAVDCALWDLEAKRAGKRAWELAGLTKPGPEITAYTLSLGEPDAMEAAARRHAHRPLLKIKLGTPDDMARLEAVRRGAPRSRIIVDANEGWSAEVYADLAPHLVRLGVALVEQPLPASDDEALLGMERPVPVCADESAHDTASLAALKGKYDVVNIKLDKTGGLTEALRLREAALTEGYGIMVGCMVGTSLAMAPAVLVAQGAMVTDLDGPLLLAQDRPEPLQFDEAGVHPSSPSLWG
ncbi:N-acetyl-D-Glu racemase DgcA [Maritimibacter sp. DP1N21-5]|uniref:N-acetyl-D-Glu racemase DgcA n=1 Tax=Maritimibacter sp. DP1N21-5 TaxID=2836867 RepID=UPI001C456C99|nr:N-acetyl-D-Glu racemase DgcA [Maritimibacter sp. DP1N21-5]MBV7408377.1 dipeptide epimerase [Maritimibacter sp. DP1N21-5]